MLKNIVSNYISRFWSLVSVFLFVPIYIKVLGLESYAVINFYTLLLTVLLFADAGLSSTLNREVAKSNDFLYLGNMLTTIERVYLFITLSVSILIIAFSKIISTYWLQSHSIPVEKLSIYISLMGIAVSIQLFTTLENSGLMGLEKQVLANTIQVVGGIFRSAIVLIPLHFSPSLITFFSWQILVNFIVLLITRECLWKYIRQDFNYVFDFNILKTVGRFAGGMMLMAIISSFTSQVDKILISKLLPLKQFGYYSLASIVSQVPVIVITPIAIALLPRFVKLSTGIHEKKELVAIYRRSSFIISAFASTCAIIIFIFTSDLIFLWTRDAATSSRIELVAKWLLVGNLFLSLQYMPYHLAIANGNTKINVRSGIVVMFLMVPSIIYFVNKFELIGAAIPWLVMNLFAFLYLGYVVIKKYVPGIFVKWLFIDTGMPLLISVLVGFLAYSLFPMFPKGFYSVLFILLTGFLSITTNWILFISIYPRINYFRF